MWEDLFIDLGALLLIISGTWMIYERIKMGPRMNDVTPYYKGKLIVAIPSGIVLIIGGIVILFRIGV